MGYSNLRHYAGGMSDWIEDGGPVERNENGTPPVSARAAPLSADTHPFSRLEALANYPLTKLITVWLGMIVAFGFLYWGAGLAMGLGLQAGSSTVNTDLDGFGTALYFSFVTALSIGYGDVIPVGPVRVLAIIEGISGLMLFGCVISKLVSRRQEELTEDIHRTTFEDRLDRVRTNLHLVFSDLGSVQQLQAEQGALPELVLRRLESTVRVFRGELQTIHDLLYGARVVPGEDALESLLANLTICLQALVDIRQASADGHSAALDSGLRALGALAREICGECVPRAYAPELKESMDQIQALAEQLV
jgi:potassium channel LctB